MKYNKEIWPAIGMAIRFYRQCKKMSQQDLAESAGTSASILAMIEGGNRPCKPVMFQRLLNALHVDVFTHKYLMELYEAGGIIVEENLLTPEDVLSGGMFFLRGMQKSFSFRQPVKEIWMVANQAFLQSHEVISMIGSMVKDTKFVFFLPSHSAKIFREAAKCMMLRVNPDVGDHYDRNVQIIESPATLCIQHYFLVNPDRLSGKMFGRTIVYSGDWPRGTYAMERPQTLNAYDLLQPILFLCTVKPGRAFLPGDDSAFMLVEEGQHGNQ